MIMLIYHITLIIMLIYSQHGICTRYGELSPASFTGKLMGGLCALCGIFFLTLPLPIVVNRFISIFCLFLFYILGPEPAGWAWVDCREGTVLMGTLFTPRFAPTALNSEGTDCPAKDFQKMVKTSSWISQSPNIKFR